jgi:hypothetical protein
VHSREHLLVSLDHGDDDGTPKCVEIRIIILRVARISLSAVSRFSSGKSARLKQN